MTKPTPKPRQRCHWAKTELSIAYHDQEWGVPIHDDRTLFEFLILEGAQAGLSWETILRKRENYRGAFDRFDAARIARYDQKKIASLLSDARQLPDRGLLCIHEIVTEQHAEPLRPDGVPRGQHRVPQTERLLLPHADEPHRIADAPHLLE